MDTVAAVITGKTSAAISAVVIEGSTSLEVCRGLTGNSKLDIQLNNYRLCSVVDGNGLVDEVLIAREQPDRYVINCHGNPLIVEKIVATASTFGAKPLTLKQYVARTGEERFACNTIAAEVRAAYCRQLSYEAVGIISNQKNGGLRAFVDKWLDSESFEVKRLQDDCRKILADSNIAKRLFTKQKIVLVGLPNSGKSTLFNGFCGREAAIVTDVCGTTRDWVSASCRIGSICCELIDTAGLDSSLCDSDIDNQSQQKTMMLVAEADMILQVVDIAQADVAKATEKLIDDCGAISLKVYNKADMYRSEQISKLADGIVISAANSDSVEKVASAIIDACEVKKITPQSIVCFTNRQRDLIKQILESDSEVFIKDKLEQIKSGNL